MYIFMKHIFEQEILTRTLIDAIISDNILYYIFLFKTEM